MIKRLLVPLDGSEVAEEALLVAGDLAESLDGTLELVRVVPPPVPGRFYAPNLLQQMEEAHVREAERYLTAVAERLHKDRLHVQTHVLTGEVASTLVGFVARDRSQLIVMASHGLGGLGWRVFGSVAQKVLSASPCPVLIVRPTPQEIEREEEMEERASDTALLGELRGERS